MKYFPTNIFYQIQKYNPCWSSFICFTCILARNQRFTRQTVRRHFNKLVDKDDYHPSEKEQVFNWLWEAYREKSLKKQ